jgi:hypothetical protein
LLTDCDYLRYDYRNFLHAKENREKEKDPQARYQKFLKQQSKHAATTASSSMSMSGTSGRPQKHAKNGKLKRDHLVIPAWMAGKPPDDEQDES